jgi:hypothetical protein
VIDSKNGHYNLTRLTIDYLDEAYITVLNAEEFFK